MEKEIKKAWETMKKEIAKECGIEGGFSMSGKQIKNRTATYCSSSKMSYEERLAYATESAEKVQGYDTWTAEEKANNWNRYLETKARYEWLISEYGTPAKKVLRDKEEIANSKAFKKFSDFVGGADLSVESTNEGWYVRFHY